MTTPGFLKTPDGQIVFGAEMPIDPNNLEWRPTVSQVRDAILACHVTGFNTTGMPLLPESRDYAATQWEVERMGILTREAVTAGRMIDFGHLPNRVIKECSIRGGEMWNAGALGFPFRDPWICYHTWDHDITYAAEVEAELAWRVDAPAVAIYLVWATNEETFEACELQPFRFKHDCLLVIGDRGCFRVPENKIGHMAAMAPNMVRFIADEEFRKVQNNGQTPWEAASANIGDPIITAVLILATRGVERETISAPPKLQRARAKNRKPPIPNYDRVDTKPYVTAILNRHVRERGASLGGHHASPQFHIRMGHPRHYATGRSIWIADTLVNATDEQRLSYKSNRSHYQVQP